MKRLSLLLCTIVALTPLLSIQQAYAMNPWGRPKKDSFARSAVLPWIRALKVPISIIGSLTCGVIGGLAIANLNGTGASSGELPVSASSVLYGLGVSYVAGVLYSAIWHKETSYQQTQDLSERTADIVHDTAVKPLKSAIKFPGAMIVIGIPAAVLMALIVGKDSVLDKITIENTSNGIQALIAVLGFAGAMEYLRQLTDFVSTKPQ